MLLFQRSIYSDASIGIKRIETFTEHAPTNQSLSARDVVFQLLGETLPIEKKENGQPFIANKPIHISLSHSKALAAAIVSQYKPVGIDIEMIHPRIERIAHKFLTEEELSNISINKIETLLLYWSAKESLYKLFAKKQLDFASQLIIKPFKTEQQGVLNASIIVADEGGLYSNLEVHYEFLEGHVLTYVLGR